MGLQYWVEKLSSQIKQEIYVGKLYGTIELTTVWKNWMTNLGDRL